MEQNNILFSKIIILIYQPCNWFLQRVFVEFSRQYGIVVGNAIFKYKLIRTKIGQYKI